MKARLKDFAVILLCLLILAASSYYLYLDFHAKPEIRGEVKQGYITFKHKVAQRKYPSRMIWEDIEQMSPIYNKDSIRTDSHSEATVTLNNGVKIELDPESMFVLNIIDKKIEIELAKGSFVVSTTKPLLNPNNFSIKNKDFKLNFTGATGEFSVAKNGNSFDIVSRKGTTGISYGQKQENIFEKQKANLISDNESLSKIDLNYFAMKPEQNARYFISSNSKEIIFEWEAKIGIEMTVEIANDPFFKEKLILIQSKENSVSRKFTEGIYFWRLKSSSGEITETRKFRIIEDLPIILISPNDLVQFKNETGESLVNFYWSKRSLAISYHFEVSSDKSFKNILYSRSVIRTSISMPFGLGEYFWRVRAFDSIKGTKPISKTYSFKVEKDSDSISSNSLSDLDESSEDTPIPLNEKSIPTNLNPQDSKAIPNTKSLPAKENIIEDKEENKNSSQPTEKVSIIKKIGNPILLFPKANSTVDMNQLDSLHFKWNKVSGANSYTIKFNQQGSSEAILETQVNATNFNFTQLDKLDIGVFIWTVEANSDLEGSEVGSTTAKFTITLGEEPAAPETISKGKKEE